MRVFLTFILAVFLTACATQSKQWSQKHNHENKRDKHSILSLIGLSQKQTSDKKREIASSEQCPDLSGTYAEDPLDEVVIRYQKTNRGVAHYTIGKMENIVADGIYRTNQVNKPEGLQPTWQSWEGELAFCRENTLYLLSLEAIQPGLIRNFSKSEYLEENQREYFNAISFKKLSTGAIQVINMAYKSRNRHYRFHDGRLSSSEEDWMSWLHNNPVRYQTGILYPKD